jgi:hypothetical protein
MGISIVGKYWVVGALTAGLLSGCGVESSELAPESPAHSTDEMQGGTILTHNEIMRSGEVEIRSGGCTGTILYTSAFERRTWVLTAAHCVCDPAAAGGAIGIKWPDGTVISSELAGVATIMPGYPTSSDCKDVADPGHDVAVIKYPFGVDIAAGDGHLYGEFKRPVWGSHPPDDVPLYRRFGALGAGKVSGYDDGDPYCGLTGTEDSTLRWATSVYGNAIYGQGDIAIALLFSPSGTYLRYGDSGGGWFTTSASSAPTLSSMLDHGVVAGVTSSMRCSPGWYTAAASSTWDSVNLVFLTNTMGNDLQVVTADWTRTCFDNWCYYSDVQKAALLVSVL